MRTITLYIFNTANFPMTITEIHSLIITEKPLYMANSVVMYCILTLGFEYRAAYLDMIGPFWPDGMGNSEVTCYGMSSV